jgi:hypothetical protein
LWDRNRRTDCWQKNTVRGCTGTVDRCSDVSVSGCVVIDTVLLKYPVLWRLWHSFSLVLGTFSKLRKASYLSLCVCLCIEQIDSYLMDFREIWYIWIFLKSVEKSQVSLKLDQNNGYFTLRPIYIFDYIWPNSS